MRCYNRPSCYDFNRNCNFCDRPFDRFYGQPFDINFNMNCGCEPNCFPPRFPFCCPPPRPNCFEPRDRCGCGCNDILLFWLICNRRF